MKNFETALLAAMDKAEQVCGVRQGRLRQNIISYGAVNAAKDYMKRGRPSDGFDALAQKKHLELTMEALVVSNAYHNLFTDEEVNACFALLCAEGYYQR